MADRLTARYEAAAPSWGRRLAWLGFPAAYRAVAARARDLLPPAGTIRALDLGSGDGAFVEALLDQLGPRLKLTLLDLSPAMLRAAEKRLGQGRARLVVGDLDAPALSPGGYDLVTAAHLLEHLPDADLALRRMAFLLKPGGTLLLMVSRPHWCSHIVWLTWRHRRFRQAEILHRLHMAGFIGLQCWPLTKGPPRRLSLAYAARRPG